MTDDTPDGPPAVKDHKGRWDEALAATIVILPWVLTILGVVYIAWTGGFEPDITLGGVVDGSYLVYGAAGLAGLTYVLALGKVFGLAPIQYIFDKAHNLAKNYNPDE